MRFGLQVHLPTYRDWSASSLLDLAARAGDVGIDQIWVTDNLGSRHALTLLGALARRGGPDLGWAVMVQYLRSPLEAASGISTVAELMGGGRFDVALGAGNPFTGSLIDKPRPIAFMSQTAACLRAALGGCEVELDATPLVRDYFHLQPGARVRPAAAGTSGRVRILGGGNGPLGVGLAARELDGLLMGWTFLPALRLGALPDIVGRTAAAGEGFVRVAELKLAMSSSHHRARRWVREKGESAVMRCVSLRRRGYSEDELVRLGIDSRDVAVLDRWAEEPYSVDAFVDPEAMIDACFVAGDTGFCAERLESIARAAEGLGFDQLMFSELGPDPRASLDLLGERILPTLRTGVGR